MREKNYVKWHPYPAEMPPHTDFKVTYLVTKEMPKTKFLESRRFQTTAKGMGTVLNTTHSFLQPASLRGLSCRRITKVETG